MPTVTVVLPFYNRATTLLRAAQSVRRQSMRDWELVAVDDGSHDDGLTMLEGLGDARVRLVRHDRNRGAAAARNTGVACARGERIAFLDSDDEWDPDMLERQCASMELFDAVCTGFRLSRHSGTVEERRPDPATVWHSAFLDGCGVSPGTTLMVRRAVWDAVGCFDESLRRLEDWDWLLRLTRRHRFGVVYDVLATIHVGGRAGQGTVLPATERLLAIHGDWILAEHGASGLRRFRAALAMERMSAALQDRKLLPAAIEACRVLRFNRKQLTERFVRARNRMTSGPPMTSPR